MPKKVLVVDDEKLIVKGIRFSLEQDGMEVDCAYDGEEAKIKDLFIQERYDEVITSLEEIFRKLFVTMLEYKGSEVKEDYKNMDYGKIAILVVDYYPRYNQTIINLLHVEYREENTYLDVINSMLSIYSYILDTYKQDYEEEEEIEIDELEEE